MRIIVAGSADNAKATAITDCCWITGKRRDTYIDDDGEEVIYVPDESAVLHALPRGTAVYPGFRWWLRKDAKVIRAMVDCGLLVEAPGNLATLPSAFT